MQDEVSQISDKEITPVSQEAVRQMTKAFPDDNNMSPARRYDQAVPAPTSRDENSFATGNEPPYV